MTAQNKVKLNKKTIPSVINRELLLDAVKHIVKGGLRFKDGHIPPPSHNIPLDFAGVGVAASVDPVVDDYLLQKLDELQVKNVRIDFSYGDENGPTARLLEKLLSTDLQILLHLVQPFDVAYLMNEKDVQQKWRQFVSDICEQFGSRVHAIEIGSAINRRRWAGYSTEGFFSAWQIAHEEITSRNITLAGPNITDFELVYTFPILERLRKTDLLPDIHTNNLFAERATEPERFDYRIIGFHWATKLKFNLVKKARLLNRIAVEKGIKQTISPSAFWTLPRIERLLENSEQKMADYLCRYMILLAASGSFKQAFWGPILCWREGLIDDGSGSYPELERIVHYKSITGELENFRTRPAFDALKQFNAIIPGSTYKGALNTAQGLEIHSFQTDRKRIHVVWTINGKAFELSALYTKTNLEEADILNRDGQHFTEKPFFITESPIYLSWPLEDAVQMKLLHTPYPLESIYAHREEGQYYPYHQDGWRGMLIAENEAEAEQLANLLHPNNLAEPNQETTLRMARNIIWTVAGPNGVSVVAKKPLKMHLHKRLLDKFKPSKARRSWIAAAELSRRGVSTAQPLAYFEKQSGDNLLENVFICEKVDNDFSVRDMLVSFHDGAAEFEGIEAQTAYIQLADFLFHMHEHGIFFRDLSGGNILIKKQANLSLSFTLIDINRARFYNYSTPLRQRISDLTRICHKLHWTGRDELVGHYLNSFLEPKTFDWRYRQSFYLYDLKVNFKRKYGRKAIKRLLNKTKLINQ